MDTRRTLVGHREGFYAGRFEDFCDLLYGAGRLKSRHARDYGDLQ